MVALAAASARVAQLQNRNQVSYPPSPPGRALVVLCGLTYCATYSTVLKVRRTARRAQAAFAHDDPRELLDLWVVPMSLDTVRLVSQRTVVENLPIATPPVDGAFMFCVRST
jgi:hypothetical protein